MSLIPISKTPVPEAEKLAEGFLEKTNQVFNEQLQACYSSVDDFWWRNVDADGNKALTGDVPSGVEMLQAMGTNAEKFYTAATQRAVMVINIATALDALNLIDMAKISAPYDLTFNPDGSLDQATLRS